MSDLVWPLRKEPHALRSGGRGIQLTNPTRPICLTAVRLEHSATIPGEHLARQQCTLLHSGVHENSMSDYREFLTAVCHLSLLHVSRYTGVGIIHRLYMCNVSVEMPLRKK